MKKFRFPLQRVKDWRDMQARIEEGQLERLYLEAQVVDARLAELAGQQVRSEQALRASGGASGTEWGAFDTFRRHLTAERARLEKQRADCGVRIAAQLHTVAEKRRGVRLLELLKEDRFKIWEREFHREIEAEADQAYLSRWKPT
jgi:flagellar export protein FliJ